MKVYNNIVIPEGLGSVLTDYIDVINSGYSAGYASGYTDALETCQEPDYSKEYFTCEILSGGIFYLSCFFLTQVGVEYSLNGENWTSGLSFDLNLEAGDIIRIRRNSLLDEGEEKGRAPTVGRGTTTFKAYGNVMSLIYGEDFQNKLDLPEGTSRNFYELFTLKSDLVDIDNLVVPATGLTEACYDNMFKQVPRLVSAGNLKLPATTLAPNCYSSMFFACSSLATAPVLPATTLASTCYRNMFNGCTSLTQAPELPATTLADSCYANMFYGCESLTQAPELPATELAERCYESMFGFCGNLNNIRCLATNTSSTNCTKDWLRYGSSTGTFIKHPDAVWERGNSGIPEGWTIMDAEI